MKKSFWIFQSVIIFSNTLLFSVKTPFLQVSADFVAGFEKLLAYVKALQTRIKIYEIKFFVALVVSEICTKNNRLIISYIHVVAGLSKSSVKQPISTNLLTVLRSRIQKYPILSSILLLTEKGNLFSKCLLW